MTRPAIGEVNVASVSPFSSDSDLRGHDVDPGAGGVDLFGPCSGTQFRERLVRRLHPALRLRHSVPRHITPRRRIVSLLPGAGVALEQRLESIEVLLGGLELRSGGGNFGSSRVDLRLRLAQVLDPRAGLDEAQLRFGGGLLSLRAIDRELHVARVEGEHGLARAARDRPP